MKLTGENLSHVGFYRKASNQSVSVEGAGGGKTEVIPDIEKPSYPADGFPSPQMVA